VKSKPPLPDATAFNREERLGTDFMTEKLKKRENERYLSLTGGGSFFLSLSGDGKRIAKVEKRGRMEEEMVS